MEGGRRRTSSAPTESSPMPLVMTRSLVEAKLLLAGEAVALEGFQRRIGVDVSLLPVDVPVAELVDGNGFAGDGAAHEAARPDHDIVAVEIADDRLGGREVLVVDVHRSGLSAQI